MENDGEKSEEKKKKKEKKYISINAPSTLIDIIKEYAIASGMDVIDVGYLLGQQIGTKKVSEVTNFLKLLNMVYVSAVYQVLIKENAPEISYKTAEQLELEDEEEDFCVCENDGDDCGGKCKTADDDSASKPNYIG